MNQSNKLVDKNTRKKNVLFAIVLGAIAFTVALMPFFYLTNAVVNG